MELEGLLDIVPYPELCTKEERLKSFNMQLADGVSTEEFYFRLSTVDNAWNQVQCYYNPQKVPIDQRKEMVLKLKCSMIKEHVSKSKPMQDKDRKRETTFDQDVECGAFFHCKVDLETERLKVVESIPHSHGVELCDHAKTSKLVQNIVKSEARRGRFNQTTGYSNIQVARNIPNIIQQFFGFDMMADLGGKEITPKTIANYQRENNVENSANIPIPQDTYQNAISLLVKNGYVCKRLSWQSGKEGRKMNDGFVFVYKEMIKSFVESGYLCLLDSTHKMAGKKSDDKLSTVYVKHKNGTWFPGGQLWLSCEDSQGIHLGLTAIQTLVASHHTKKWEPRYFVIDQSNIERNGIEKTFPGIPERGVQIENHGQGFNQKVDIFLCKVLGHLP